MNRIDAVPLTQAMERANTVNPHGDEDLCTTQLADLLKSPGFACRKVEFAPQRSSLVVRCGGSSGPSRRTTVSRVQVNAGVYPTQNFPRV